MEHLNSIPEATPPQSLRSWLMRSRAGLVMSNVAWQIATKCTTSLLALAAAGFVARGLGPEGLGVYRNAQAGATLLAALGAVISNQVLIQRMLKSPAREGAYLGTAMMLAGAGGLAALLIATLIPWQFGQESARFAVIVAAAYFPILFMVPLAAWYESRLAGRVLAVCNTAGMAITRAWEIGCALLSAGVVAFCFSQTAGYLLMSMLVLAHYRRVRSPDLTLSWDANAARDLAAASLPWLLLAFVTQTQSRCELFMLTALLGTKTAGHYSAAGEFLQPFLFVPAMLLSSLFPSVVRSYAADPKLGAARIQQYLRLSVCLSAGCAICISVAAPWLTRWIYGSGFAETAPILRILAWMLVPTFLSAPCQAWLVTQNLGWTAVMMALAGLLVCGALDWILIPKLGTVGAAITATAGLLPVNLTICLLNPKTRILGRLQLKALIWPVPSLRAIMPISASARD